MTSKFDHKLFSCRFLMRELYYVGATIFFSGTDAFCKIPCFLLYFVSSKLQFPEVIWVLEHTITQCLVDL